MTPRVTRRTFDAPGPGHLGRCPQQTHQPTARTLHPHPINLPQIEPTTSSSLGCRDTGALSSPLVAGGPSARPTGADAD